MKIKQNFKKIMKINAVLVCAGLIFGLCSFAPTITAKTVFKTLAFDKKMNMTQDFAKGQFNNLKLEEKAGGVEISSSNGKEGVYISPVAQAPFKATHVGLHWEEELTDGSLINAYLRTGDDGENFGEWVKTRAERDGGKDGVKTDETFASLVGIGKADFAQAKIEFIPGKGISPKIKALTFTFLNSAEESGQTTKKLSFVPRSAAEGTGITKISPNGQSINVINREDWGANEDYRTAGDGSEEWSRSYHGTRKLVIHHTADAGSNGVTDPETNKVTIRSIYYYHAVTRGWGDIGYNALVDAAGNIYEGRYGTHGETHFRSSTPSADQIMILDVETAHVSSYNSGSFGVSALGNFTDFEVPDTQVSAIEDVLAYVTDSRGINAGGNSDFLRYDDAWHYDLNNIMTHRDVGQTACPGDYLYAEVGDIKLNVANRMISNMSGFIAVANLIPTSNASGENIGSSTVTVSWDAFAGAAEYEYILEKVFGVVDVASTSEPWDVAWFYPENPNMTITSNVNVVFDVETFDDESEYVFYVRALDGTGTPISAVSHVDFLKDENNIIVDNLASLYTSTFGGGEWTHSVNVSGYYAQDYQPNQAGNGSDIFEWAPNIFKDGYYDVLVMYTAALDRNPSAPYTVFYEDEGGALLQETVTVNQKTNGGVWFLLGNYYFERGGAPKVQLSDDIRRGYVIADAVKFAFDRPADGSSENQPPVANAGENQNVVVNTEVSFNGGGSTDDGMIVSYEWDFGDGATGSGITSTHTYTATGTYTVTLTVTDDGGLISEDTMIVTVTNEVVVSDMMVANIDMGLQTRGVFTSAMALITIVDADNAPVDGATVSGSWNGLTDDTDSAVTDINGQVTVESDFVKNASGTYTFTVYSVVKSGWVYDSASNVETSDSVSTTQ